MKATRKETGAVGRGCGIGAALVIGLSLLLAPASAGAISYLWQLTTDGGESPCASRVRPVQSTTPTCYTSDGLNTGTSLFFDVTVDAPNVASISNGDTITIHDFALPQPTQTLDIFGNQVTLMLGLANLGGGGAVIPDTSFTMDLVGTLVETSPGFFAVTFPDFEVYWRGDSAFVFNQSGSFPFSLSTLQTTINVASTTPGVPGTCTGGGAGTSFPNFPMPGQSSDFSSGSLFVMGGATCPTGLSALTSLTEQPFSIELRGTLLAPEPGTLLLVTSGLLGLAAVGRRRPLA